LKEHSEWCFPKTKIQEMRKRKELVTILKYIKDNLNLQKKVTNAAIDYNFLQLLSFFDEASDEIFCKYFVNLYKNYMDCLPNV